MAKRSNSESLFVNYFLSRTHYPPKVKDHKNLYWHYNDLWSIVTPPEYSPSVFRPMGLQQISEIIVHLDRFFSQYHSKLICYTDTIRHRSDSPYQQALRCQYLTGGYNAKPCQQIEICPFCRCEERAVRRQGEYYGLVKSAQECKKSVVVGHFGFVQKEPITYQSAYQLTRAKQQLIHAKSDLSVLLKQIREAGLLRKTNENEGIDHLLRHSIHPCLVADDKNGVKVAIKFMFLANSRVVDRVEDQFHQFATTQKEKYRKYKFAFSEADWLKITDQVGWLYRYPRWLISLPGHVGEEYLRMGVHLVK